jgi:WD40 repeat protein
LRITEKRSRSLTDDLARFGERMAETPAAKAQRINAAVALQEDDQLGFYTIPSGTFEKRFILPAGYKYITAAPSGNMIVLSAYPETTVVLFGGPNFAVIGSVEKPAGCEAAFTPNDQLRIHCADGDNTWQISEPGAEPASTGLNAMSGATGVTRRMIVLNSPGTALAGSSDGFLIATGSGKLNVWETGSPLAQRTGQIQLWDRQGTHIADLPLEVRMQVSGLGFGSKTNVLGIALGHKIFALCSNVTSSARKCDFLSARPPNDRLSLCAPPSNLWHEAVLSPEVSFSGNDEYVAGLACGMVTVWRVDTAQLHWALKSDVRQTAVTFLGDDRIAVGFEDGEIATYDVGTHRRLRRRYTDDGTIAWLHGDGTGRIISGSADGRLHVWDGQLKSIADVANYEVTLRSLAISFSTDNRVALLQRSSSHNGFDVEILAFEGSGKRVFLKKAATTDRYSFYGTQFGPAIFLGNREVAVGSELAVTILAGAPR